MTTASAERILATRGSPLATRQAAMALEALQQHMPGETFRLEFIKTTGDKQTRWSLERTGGGGLFTSELENAVANGHADLAVHSAKDLPTTLQDNTVIAAFLPRENPVDVLITRDSISVPKIIATSSPRRRAQAKKLFPRAVWTDIRGNVDTRLKKIAEGTADATFLAIAGLKRLGITNWPGLSFRPLDIRQMVPAPGQAAIALQALEAQSAFYAPVNDPATFHAVTLERLFLRTLGGGCHTPTGAFVAGGQLHVFHEEEGHAVHVLPSGADYDACAGLVVNVAEKLKSVGA